ncbi:MAG: molybdate ABC transporter substrate-binding protein [Burkholderiales bacterium]
MKFENYSKPRSVAPLQRRIRALLNDAFRALAPCLAAALLFAALPGRAEDMLVSAAASLTNAFKDIGAEFEKSHPGTKVNFNFAASDILMKQIVEGAPADVFASADLKAMDTAAQQNAIDVSTRKNFAANRLALALPRDTQLTLTSLEDLKRDAVKRIAISQPATVPVGRYAKAALDEAKLWSAVEDKLVFTQNVRQSLDYVSRSEVDAGFVYTTDAALMKDKVKVAFEIPTPQPVVYPIAVTKRSKQGKLAREFVDLVNSEAGQSILQSYGFAKP